MAGCAHLMILGEPLKDKVLHRSPGTAEQFDERSSTLSPDLDHWSGIGSVVALSPAGFAAQSAKFAHSVVARGFVGWRTFAP